MSRVKSLKLEKRKHQLNNTIENLYHQNSNDNFSFISDQNHDETVKSTYFTEQARNNCKSKPLDKLYNLFTQKSHESTPSRPISSLQDQSFSLPLQNLNDGLEPKRCKISVQSGERSKFKLKQPLLAKKITR